MLAYIEPDGRCIDHNEAFRRRFCLKADASDKRYLRALLGEHGYREAADRVREVLSGRLVHYCCERPVNGHHARAYIHLVPHFDAQGRVAGAYALVVDDEHCRPSNGALLQPADPAEGVQELYASSGNDSREWHNAAACMREALRRGEFRLYRQTIEDLSTGDGSFHGIFVRQVEEEENRLPPGTFFALAEEFSLLKELDRWVVSRVLRHEAQNRRQGAGGPSMYCIHLSRDSISDPDFPDFVAEELRRAGIAAETLCFEIQESDANRLRSDSVAMARQLRRAGVHVMLGGFGRGEPSLSLLRDLPVDFVKFDGSLILKVACSDSALAKLRAIVQLAHARGINTVAEFAESGEVLAKLRETKVDYAQGVAVSPAVPIEKAPKRASDKRSSQ